MKIIYLVIYAVFMLLNSYGQSSFDYAKERNVFNKNLIRNEFRNRIDVKRINDDEQFQGKYLGKIKTDLGEVYYVVNSTYLFDKKTLAKTENQVFLYDSKKDFVGYYYLGQLYELPDRLLNNRLIFNVKGCNEKISISFKSGIPRAINLVCNGSNNYYEFHRDPK